MIIQPGDTIGFVTPSSPLREGRIESGIRFLNEQGFNVKVGKHAKDGQRFLAGNDADRAQDLMDFFNDDSVQVIMATCGGYGSQRLLPLLDFDLIKNKPKLLTGFSDTTALQLGLYTKTQLITASGFTLRDLDNGKLDPLIARTWLACLRNEPFVVNEGTSAIGGVVQGILIGGTLSLITALMGTPYQPNFQEAILLIEDVFAEPFQVDCMLSQLELAGVFKQIKGVIFGQFVFCDAKENPQRDGTIDEVVDEWIVRINRPCLKNFPYGHGDRRCVLPIGRTVLLDATQGALTIV